LLKRILNKISLGLYLTTLELIFRGIIFPSKQMGLALIVR